MGNLIRVKWIYNFLLLGLLGCIAISFNLWMPHSPIPAYLALPFEIPAEIQWIGLVLFLGGIAFSLLMKRWILVPMISLLGLIILIVSDLNRLQPWIYFSLIVWIPLWWYPIHYYKFKSWDSVLNALRWILILVVLWSGINKLNVYYFGYVSAYLTDGLSSLFGLKPGSLRFLAWGAPVLQILSSLLLLLPRFRTLALVALTGIQLFGVLLISAVNQWNFAIIPWNIAVLGMFWLCFYRINNRWNDFSIRKKPILQLLVLAVAILPALGKIVPIPPALTFHLYSGQYTYGLVYVERANGPLIPNIPDDALVDVGSYWIIDLAYWSDDAYHLPLYPHLDNYQQISDSIQRQHPNKDVFLKTIP